MAKIKQVRAREILNGAGELTIETTVILSDGRFGISSVPSSHTAGAYEASSLLTSKAVSNVKDIIAPAVIGMDAEKQQEVDKKMIELDGTANKGRLGANAILSVSMSVAKAAAQSSMLPTFLYLREYIRKENLTLKIPTPIVTLINGNREENSSDFKDIMVMPPSSLGFSDSITTINKVRSSLLEDLRTENLSTLSSNLGGYSPRVLSNENALNLVKQGIESSNLRLGFDLFMAIDANAKSFYNEGKYKIKDNAQTMSAQDLSIVYSDLIKKFNLIYIEDPFIEEDWGGWTEFTANNSAQTLVVGDNLIVTNPYRLQMALDKKAVTGVVIKPIQIGTVIEAIAVVEVARIAGLKVIVSGRSAETNDDFIADFAVGVSADYVRFGSLNRGELVTKYNRLLDIEKQIKSL